MDLNGLKKLDKKYAQVIADYLLKRIETDQCLKEKLEATDKTLKGCIEYCKSEARKQAVDGCAMVCDEEVYEWSVHYFLEDSLNNEPKAQKTSEKTLKDKKQVKELSNEDDENEEGTPIIEVKEKKPKKAAKEKLKEQLTLFDF